MVIGTGNGISEWNSNFAWCCLCSLHTWQTHECTPTSILCHQYRRSIWKRGRHRGQWCLIPSQILPEKPHFHFLRQSAKSSFRINICLYLVLSLILSSLSMIILTFWKARRYMKPNLDCRVRADRSGSCSIF